MPSFTSILNRRFGKLTVVSETDRSMKRTVVVRCDCGTTKSVLASNLRSGKTASCGCNRATTNGVTHGRYGTPTYISWQSMLARCYYAAHKSYADYGGRGVSVCREWRSDFSAFLSDMGERPLGTTLDRYPNVNGNYEPGNCRWATAIKQQNNRRTTTMVEHRGQQIALADLGRLLGIKHVTMKRRYRAGDRGERLARPELKHLALSQKGK